MLPLLDFWQLLWQPLSLLPGSEVEQARRRSWQDLQPENAKGRLLVTVPIAEMKHHE